MLQTAGAATAPDRGGHWRDGFTSNGRFGRLSFVAWCSLFLWGGLVLAFGMLVSLGALNELDLAPARAEAAEGAMIVLGFAVGLVMLAAVAGGLTALIRRLHDLNLSGWMLLLLLAPLLNLLLLLVLLLRRGTPGTNHYGPPRAAVGWERVLGWSGGLLLAVLLSATAATLVQQHFGPPETPSLRVEWPTTSQ
jgi:uncharacterized membrane protein YhaH (DUF805 family)